MSTKSNQVKLSIRSRFLLLCAAVTILTAALAIGTQYYFSKKLATQAAFSLYELSANNTRDYIASLDTQALNVSKILAKHTKLTENGQVIQGTRELFAQVMRNNPVFYAIYIGFENGDFYELINLESDPVVRQQYDAKPQDRWVLITINNKDGQRIRQYNYFDQAFKLRTVTQQQSDYYANKRPWYTNVPAQQTRKSEPYLFQLLKIPGQTYSTKLPSGTAVLGIDIALTSISNYLSQQRINSIGEVYLSKTSGEIIASNASQQQIEVLTAIEPLTLTQAQQTLVKSTPTITIASSMNSAPIDFAVSGHPQGYAVDIISIIEQMTGLQFQYINGFKREQLIEKFNNNEIDMRQAVYDNPDNEHSGLISSSFTNLPFTLITGLDTPDISRLEMLSGRSLAIIKDWSVTNTLQQNFPKIKIVELATRKDVIDAVRSGKVDAGLDVKVIIERLMQQFFITDLKYHDQLSFEPVKFPNTLHFLSQHDNKELAALIDYALSSIPQQQHQALKEKWFTNKNTSQNKIINGLIPYAELINPPSQTAFGSTPIMTRVDGIDYVLFSKSINIHPEHQDIFSIVIPVDKILAESLKEAKFSIVIVLFGLCITLPISWLLATPLVKTQHRVSRENKELKQHQHDQQDLLEAFTQIIGQAIDDKSSYTAKHCERVPDLAVMLADHASDSTLEAFKNFSFNQLERREFSIAAWLHDCGKVTTPDHVINKGTKLEGIYNRIHEIRMRFEVLWRDAEINYLTQLHQQPDNMASLQDTLQRKRATLVDDFEFIANTNIGCEFMPHRDIVRLRSLSNITWQRYFDDTLGLSATEMARTKLRANDFPITESLLMDKPEHIIKRQQPIVFNPKHKIKMKVPQHLYNNGELYNLSVARGTLTPEERFKINEHIISTIKMLEALPLPPELAKVPQYASTHHETMKGSGYPRGLSAEQLTIPDRIMAIADIFEALTSPDRPYKSPKTVSVAIDILYNMALGNQIDMDIFKLLLTSGIYLEYGERFLPPEQMDLVNIEKYLEQQTAVTE